MRTHKFIYISEHPEISGNAIYAVNHSNKYDAPYTCEIISKQSYVLVGKQPLELIDRLFFIINGTVWVDRKDKVDKKKSSAEMINLLKNGANFVMFPEGTWNLTPSKPMLPLYWGIIDIAKFSDKPIIPVVLEYTKENCYVSFGDAMYIEQTDDKGEKIGELRDRFATLKWTTWEMFDDTGCNTESKWNSEVCKRITEYPKLDIEYEQSVVRREYDAVKKVFAHLENIHIGMDTAFLFNKRNHIF